MKKEKVETVTVVRNGSDFYTVMWNELDDDNLLVQEFKDNVETILSGKKVSEACSVSTLLSKVNSMDIQIAVNDTEIYCCIAEEKQKSIRALCIAFDIALLEYTGEQRIIKKKIEGQELNF